MAPGTECTTQSTEQCTTRAGAHLEHIENGGDRELFCVCSGSFIKNYWRIACDFGKTMKYRCWRYSLRLRERPEAGESG